MEEQNRVDDSKGASLFAAEPGEFTSAALVDCPEVKDESAVTLEILWRRECAQIFHRLAKRGEDAVMTGGF